MPATFAELQALLRDLAHTHPVRPSATTEDATEVEVHRHPVCVEWNAPEQRLELTVPLPDPLHASCSEAARCHLYRTLLAWQWAEPTGANHLSFGITPDDAVVGLASIEAQPLHDAQALYAAIEQAHDALFAVWVRLGAQVIEDTACAAAMPAGPVLAV
ncbi:MAG: hypothetical protein IBJ04_19435 [Hydrogenophaga sp.]|uniref:hypothetical protein n=1 Tax=Hydrogenophaga sp. TaxID=1904254 RepID=UPI00257C8A96|nr:hypothetical protein [Hydrogenophaga sp.]MBL0946492.1 hypothetical protein [Hydrogenophaga sp.]